MSIRSDLRTALRRVESWAGYQSWRRFSAEGRSNARRLNALRNRFRGRRCFVMGNGPSLLECDLDLIAGEVSIVSNANYLIWDRLRYVPSLLTVEDTLVAEDRGPEIRALRGITKVFPFDLRYALGKSDAETIYIHFDRLYPDFPRFSFDLERVGYWGGTVSFLNLQVAAYVGCNPIVLIGFDHNYQVPVDQVRDTVIVSRDEDVNHIHPDYFGPGYRWHDPRLDRMEAAYHCAHRELESAGIHVVNATVGGHLEVFERVEYASLF